MTRTVQSLTTRICSSPIDRRAAPATRAYRLRRSFAAVQFDLDGKGRIVVLPEGAELRVIGLSRLCECCEVLWEDQLYNIFNADLLGPWSSRIESIRAIAEPACA